MTIGTRVYKQGSPSDYTAGRQGVIVDTGQGVRLDKALVKWDENGKETWVQIGGYRGVHEITENGVMSQNGNEFHKQDVLASSVPKKYGRVIVHPREIDKAAAELAGSKGNKS
jgi:hypothetical protein